MKYEELKLSRILTKPGSYRLSSLLLYIFFGLSFASLSLVNHYFFRTTAWDLGVYNQVIFDYSQFQFNSNTLLFYNGEPIPNKLGDHFDPILFLIAPFRYIFGSYTLLIAQIAAILFGGLGIQKLGEYYELAKSRILLALVFFFSQWAIFAALSFDYHDNVLGAQFLPWIFLFFVQKKYLKLGIVFFLALISKETIAMILIAFSVSMILELRKSKKSLVLGTSLALIALVYFVVVKNFLMPYLSGLGDYLHLKYSVIDNSPSGILELLGEPKELFSALFLNHIDSPFGENIKAEFYIMALLSGGILLIRRPAFLVVIAPIVAMKVFHDDVSKWGAYYHYSIELVPIFAIAMIRWIYKDGSFKFIGSIQTVLVLLSLWVTIYTFNHRELRGIDKAVMSPLKSQHWQRNFDVDAIHNELVFFQKDPTLKISAHYKIVPHVAFRDAIYHYPTTEDAEYIILPTCMPNENYPLNRKKYNELIVQITEDPLWLVHKETEELIIFRRNPNY